MPLVRLETNVPLNPQARDTLCADLSRLCAEVIGKPEAYVMAIVNDQAAMVHAGTPGPAAFVDVRSIGGLSPKANRTLAQRIGTLVTNATQIPGARTYLNFTDVAATHWGHDGSTFG